MGALSPTNKIEVHDLLCCLRLMKTKTLPNEFREQIRQALAQQLDGTIEQDPAKWEGYCLRPLSSDRCSRFYFYSWHGRSQ